MNKKTVIIILVFISIFFLFSLYSVSAGSSTWSVDSESEWSNAESSSHQIEISGTGIYLSLGSWVDVFTHAAEVCQDGSTWKEVATGNVDCSIFDSARFIVDVHGDEGAKGHARFKNSTGEIDTVTNLGTSYETKSTSIDNVSYGSSGFYIRGTSPTPYPDTEGCGKNWKIQGANYTSIGLWNSSWHDFGSTYVLNNISFDVDGLGGGLKYNVSVSDDGVSVKDYTGWTNIGSTGSVVHSSFSGLDVGQYMSIGFNLTNGSTPLVDSFVFSVSENLTPSIEDTSPVEDAEGVATSIGFVNVTIHDAEGDTFNWSIETSPDIGNSSGTDEGNGTKSCSVSGLSSATTYTVYVNVSDSAGNILNTSFSFKTFGIVTMYCYNESNPSNDISTFTVEATNPDGSDTYQNNSFNHGGTVGFDELPSGNNIYFVINASGYKPRVYHYELDVVSDMAFTFYLAPESESYLYLFSVVDIYDVGIKNANILFKKNIEGTYENISSVYTRTDGEVEIYLIPFTTYKLTISKSGYITESEDYIPSDSLFTAEFQLDLEHGGSTVDEQLWDNITWNIDPDVITHRTNITFFFNISSSTNSLQWYRMRLQYYNETSGIWETEFTQNNSDAGGGSIFYTSENKSGRFRLDAWFKKQNFSEFQFGDGLACRYYVITWEELTESLEDIPDDIYFLIIIVLAIAGIGVLLQLGAGELSGLAGLFVMGIGVILYPTLVISGIAFWQVVVASGIAYVAIMYLVGRI